MRSRAYRFLEDEIAVREEQGEHQLTPQGNKSTDEAGQPSAADSKDTTKNRDEIALDLMKFIAVTTGYGKGNSPAAGFSGKAGKSAEEYADALIQLFEKCRDVVAKPVNVPK